MFDHNNNKIVENVKIYIANLEPTSYNNQNFVRVEKLVFFYV